MVRMSTIAWTLLALVLLLGNALAADKGKAKAGKNQMVKGTIKSVNVQDGVLIVSQKLKSESVDRQLDILNSTVFVLTVGGETKEVLGKDGLALLEGKEGVKVSVKCDKDVNVLKVTVKLKK